MPSFLFSLYKHRPTVYDGHTQCANKCALFYKGRLQNPTADWPAVPSGSRGLSLFRTIKTGQNWTELPIDQRLGFEVVTKESLRSESFKCKCKWPTKGHLEYLRIDERNKRSIQSLLLPSCRYDFDHHHHQNILNIPLYYYTYLLSK